MPPRTPLRLSASLLRQQAKPAPWQQAAVVRVAQRGFADDRPIADRPFTNPPDVKEKDKGPNVEQLGHVSEEAAATSQSMGEDGPDLDQGTPVSEVVKGDKEAEANLPKVMKDQIKKQGGDSQAKRSYSTYARSSQRFSSRYGAVGSRSFSTSLRKRQTLDQGQSLQNEGATALQLGGNTSLQQDAAKSALQGLKFGPPQELAEQGHLKKRYEPIVDQVTKLFMKDGKLSAAQRQMQLALDHLRTAPPPKPSPSIRLVPDAPPHEVLPLNPTTYIQVAVDSVAPLIRLRSLKGLAGGGMALQVPQPLFLRQRRRTAIVWMLEQAEKRKGGTSPFGKRFAEEVVAVVEGRSSIWERRGALHALGMRSRANIATANRRSKKK